MSNIHFKNIKKIAFGDTSLFSAKNVPRITKHIYTVNGMENDVWFRRYYNKVEAENE